MAKQQFHSVFQVSKDENLVNPKDGGAIVGTARYLKPCVQTVTQAVTVPNTPLLFDVFSQNLGQWPEDVEIKGWHIPQNQWEEWVDKMAGKHGGKWNLTGICEAIMSSTYEIRSNKDLLLGLVEFWCPETNTFVFPWGEATVTLEDVMILGGFSTLGESVTRPLEGKLVKIEEELRRKHLIMARNKSKKANHSSWLKHFMEVREEREFEHVAFLSLWLSRYVFPSLNNRTVAKQVFPVAIHLSLNKRIALAPAVLASLYKNLTLLKNQAMSCRQELTVSGPLQLLQLWAFERFPSLGPSVPNTLKPGEPRAARFHKLNAKISLSLVRSVLRLPDNFRWRPYTADLKNWSHPSYYKETKKPLTFHFDDADEDLKSFARCLHSCVLVGIDCKEEYLPHRVAMQFGYDQDLPAAFPVLSIPWQNAKFVVPPRSLVPCVSARYYSWWMKSNSARKAALRDMKTSVLDKRNVEKSPTSFEFGVKKFRTLDTKLSTKVEAQGCCSSSANVCAAKTKTQMTKNSTYGHVYPMYSLHRPPKADVDSKGPATNCRLKSTTSHIPAVNNNEESHASGHPELPFMVKRQAYEELDDTDHSPPSARMKHVSGTPNRRAGFCRASPTSGVPNGNVRKRKFPSTVARRTKPTTLPFDGNVKKQMNVGSNAFDHAPVALYVSKPRSRVTKKKTFDGPVQVIEEGRKARMDEGVLNVASKVTASSSVKKFGLELEGRLRRLEKLAGIIPK